MEILDCSVSRPNRKRKLSEFDDDRENSQKGRFSMDDLNEDILEKVLSWLPTSTFFRLTSVCNRWKSIACSQSFRLSCSQIPSRDPWFFMIGSNLSRRIIFDSAENTWRKLNNSSKTLTQTETLMPIAASGGLICFRCGVFGNFLVQNPVTGSSRELPGFPQQDTQPLHAIAMNASKTGSNSYRLISISGETPELAFRVYDSRLEIWGPEITLHKKFGAFSSSIHDSSDENDVVYFLSKSGNVVSANLQRSPSKQYSSVTTLKSGEEIVYFLGSSGTILCCNIDQRNFVEFPRLLPPFIEYSIDVVECNGEMLVVLLSEFFECASVRVWRFDENAWNWVHVSAMPPAMSNEFYGKKGDINCVGAGEKILVCCNSPGVYRYFVYDLVVEEWRELPGCLVDGEAADFVSALSFEPRIEASV